MVEITVTHSAISDLQSIYDYIALDSERYAHEFTENLFVSIDILHKLPKAGRKVSEFENENLRELIYRKYRIVYLIVSPEHISIIRIIHGAKLLNL